MENQQVLISKKFEFSASHRYWREEWSQQKNEQIFGLCTSPYGHGHNYELHVTVAGKIDSLTGMIINLTDLKKHVSTIVEQFDHKYLNIDTPFFKERVPTTENLALVLFDLVDKQLQVQGQGGFHLQKIRLYERRDLYVDVWRSER
jgi:6-pyruvoyltetrahydropterin/6-carboxytetrahydropterin synthase